jgi:hypothetical protein
MSRKAGETFIIEEEPERMCELCGKMAECRPYGPKGEQVCFECGMKYPGVAERQFAKRLGIRPLQ